MSRSVDEWIGKSDDQAVPPRVRLRIWDKADGHCEICTRKINAGERWVADHKKAIVNGGANRESNLQLICDWCDRKVKTPADVAEKAEVYAVRTKHLGISESKTPMPFGRKSPWKKKFDGTIVRRDQ